MVDDQHDQVCSGFQDWCCSTSMWLIFGATGFVLLLSLTGNILSCTRNYRKDHSSKFLPRFRRSFSFRSKEVEDSPVYGNINYIYTGVEQQGDGQPLEPETGRKGIMPRQMCYAKLELASSRDHRGRKLNKTQYAETLDMLKKSRADRKAQQGVPGVPASNSLSRTLPSFLESGDLEPSELYASVRMAKAEGKAQRLEYVNKESLKI
ncbi:uncharacterized protein LOC144487199 isoform X1 [Mustelus asterias]